MIIRQLRPRQYDSLHQALMKQARAEPLCASYFVPLKINSVEYEVQIQPENRNRMAVLQAFRVDRDEYGPNFELITGGGLLSAFLEILVYQGLR